METLDPSTRNVRWPRHRPSLWVVWSQTAAVRRSHCCQTTSGHRVRAAAIVPLPRVHLVRYAGCLAPHSQLRGAIIPTPRQQGVDGDEANPGTPRWSWARLLGRVFALDMATCPLCRRGSLRIIAAITQEAVITRILRHCKLASVPPPIAPARSRQETFDWVA